MLLTLGSQNPFGKVGGGQPARVRRIVAQPQPADFHGGAPVHIRGNEYGQLLSNRMAVVFEYRIALAMAGAMRVILTNGQSRRGPDRAALFIPQVNHFRLRVAHRVVMPWRE